MSLASTQGATAASASSSFVGIVAARLRHVGAPAAATADLLRDHVHQVAGLHLRNLIRP